MQSSRESTPENHPTFGVHLSQRAINEILECLIPGCTVKSISPLQHGKSFNNRILFLEIQIPQDDSILGLSNNSVNELVLKVNGRFFDLSKSLNEVSCLSLLRRHVPEIPSPTLLAWSESNTSIIHRFTPQGIPERKSFSVGSITQDQHHDWILMTRVSGDPLPDLALGKDELRNLGRQLADIVFGWRTSLPTVKTAGNLHCEASGETARLPDCSGIAGLQITPSSSMPGFGIEVREPITNQQQYYQLRLETRLQKLQELDVFKQNRHLVPSIQTFIASRLPLLELCTRKSHFVFTHNDLSPRNILVAMDPIRISGVIDFEFAGFFPQLDEFVNDAVCNEGDWPAALYDAYLDRLEDLGMQTPRKGLDERIWREATTLARLEDNIAPWWLENDNPSDRTGPSQELASSEAMVLEAIQVLQSVGQGENICP